MKLDSLTPLELDCYENWSLADEQGGDCQDIGRAWAAFGTQACGVGDDDDKWVVIVEDDQGFVDAATYTEPNKAVWANIVENLKAEDAAFSAEVDEE